MLKSILQDVSRLLEQRKLTLSFVDIGSRNGVLELRDLARFIDAYGFEPNPDEYDKLITGETDGFKLYGTKPPNYRSLTYQPYAISNKDGEHEFYVTPGPGAAGLLEPDLERLREIIWKGRQFKKNFGDDIFSDYKKINVGVRTLDSFVKEKKIGYIDYLKIDVEGSEYEIFEGAREILPLTGVIKTETCFIPFRKGQKLFSHVDLLLREFGFDLIRYEIEQAQVGYKQRLEPVEYLPGQFSDPYGQPLSCDAIYVNRNITDPDRALAQAVILIDKKYLDEGLHILKTRAAVKMPTLEETLRTAECYDALGYRLKGMAYRFVDNFVNKAAEIRAALGL